MINCIILAGGRGKRFKGDIHKLLVKFKNKSIIDHTLDKALKLKLDNIICVSSQLVQKHITKKYKKIICINQINANGTANAVKLGLSKLSKNNGAILVLYADMPLIKLSSLKKIIYAYKKNGKALLSYFKSKKLIEFGFIKSKNNKVLKVTEFKKYLYKNKKIEHIYNGGFFICDKKFLEMNIKKVKKDKVSNEFLLTDIFSLAYLEKLPFYLFKVTRKEMYGLNTNKDLDQIKKII